MKMMAQKPLEALFQHIAGQVEAVSAPPDWDFGSRPSHPTSPGEKHDARPSAWDAEPAIEVNRLQNPPNFDPVELPPLGLPQPSNRWWYSRNSASGEPNSDEPGIEPPQDGSTEGVDVQVGFRDRRLSGNSRTALG